VLPSVTPARDEREEAGRSILLSGGKPDTIYARLSTGDSLRLHERGTQRVRQRWLLIDPERLFEHSLFRVAQAAPLLTREAPFDAWLTDRIDAAIADVLRQDQEAVLSGAASWQEEHYAFLEEWMNLEPLEAMRASVRFNGLAEPARRAFFALLVDGKSVAACLEEGLGPPEALRENARLGVTALIGPLGDTTELSATLEDRRP
jgi:hypothetical protein